MGDAIDQAKRSVTAGDVEPYWDYAETVTDRAGRAREVRKPPPDTIERFRTVYDAMLDKHFNVLLDAGRDRGTAHLLADFAAMNEMAEKCDGDLGKYVRRLRAKRLASTLREQRERAARRGF